MKINIIVAVSQDGAIGRGNSLLWHLPGDMKFFRETTTGHPVIMGRKTFESIGRPLPRRTNIVISRGEPELPEGVVLAHSLDEALAAAAEGCAATVGGCTATGTAEGCAAPQTAESFILGGGQIYAEAMRVADTLYITRVLASVDDADTFFPAIDPSVWNITSASEVFTDPESGIQYRFEKYDSNKQ